MSPTFSLAAAGTLLSLQDGVVARRQLRELGAGDHDIERLLRRRELAAVHPGVYVAHTGELSEEQREWAAVLAFWPAALAHRSALPPEARSERGRRAGPIHVAVDEARRPRSVLHGVRVQRVVGLDARVAWRRNPPRVRIEHAAIDVASQLLGRDRVADAYELLARICRTRLTTPERICDTLGRRARVGSRGLLGEMLADLADGACSVLERGYLQRVERPHGLPEAHRQTQRRPDGLGTYVDVDYGRFGLIVELDGQAFHDGPRARDRDASRDLANLAQGGEVTVRITYGLVFDSPCRTATQVARLLQQRGWTGVVRPCSRCRAAA